MRHPVTFPMLCVLAKEQLLEDPTISNGEWADRVKDRLVRLRLGYPDPPHRMTDALHAVERALAREGRPRPRPARPGAPSAPPPAIGALSHDEAKTALARLGAIGRLRTMPTPAIVPRRVLAAHKAAALVAAELVASIARCEALERATPGPEPTE